MSRFLYPIITFFGFFILCELGVYLFDTYVKEKEHKSLNATSFIIAQNIQQQITMGISSTTTLESMLRLNNFKVDNFEKWSDEIIKNVPYIDTLQLAPDGIVKYIHPMKDHKKAIGHNLFADEKRRKGALKAIETNGIVFIGPLKLIQNNKLAIIVRKPIYKLEEKQFVFWGFATSIIYIKDILKNAFKGLDKSHLSYKLYGSNPDFPDASVIMESDTPLTAHSSSFPIEVPNAKWHLSIKHTHDHTFSKFVINIVILIFSLYMSLLIFYFERRSFIHKSKLKKLNNSLVKMANTDILTNLANRRSAIDFITKNLSLCKREKKDFSLCFFDIDLFKKINDTYGHEVGDLALIHLSKLCENKIRKSDMFARWGGEEFILILPSTNVEGAYIISENIRKLIYTTPLLANNKKIQMSISIGITTLQTSNEDINDLLLRVDSALYEAKENGRNQTIIK